MDLPPFTSWLYCNFLFLLFYFLLNNVPATKNLFSFQISHLKIQQFLSATLTPSPRHTHTHKHIYTSVHKQFLEEITKMESNLFCRLSLLSSVRPLVWPRFRHLSTQTCTVKNKHLDIIHGFMLQICSVWNID